MVSTIDNDIDRLVVELAEKARLLRETEDENIRLRQRLRLLEKALFGPRSERIIDLPGNQLLFEDLVAEVTALSEKLDEQERELEKAKITGTSKKRKQRRTLQELIPDDLPREEIIIDVPEEDRVCLETGEPLVRLGEERTEKLAYKPGSYYLKVFILPKYVSTCDASQGVLNQRMPKTAIPGSYFDESFLAGIVVDKCAYHLPLYR